MASEAFLNLPLRVCLSFPAAFLGARAALALASLYGAWLEMENPAWKEDPAARRQVCLWLNVLKRIREKFFRVNAFIVFSAKKTPLSSRFAGFWLGVLEILLFFAFVLCGNDLIFICVMVILAADSIIDMMTEILPDTLTLALCPLFWLLSGLSWTAFMDNLPILAVFLACLGLAWLYGRGRGDLKLIAAMGVFIGVPFAACACLLAAGFFLAARPFLRGREIPLAPFFCLAFPCAWLLNSRFLLT